MQAYKYTQRPGPYVPREEGVRAELGVRQPCKSISGQPLVSSGRARTMVFPAFPQVHPLASCCCCSCRNIKSPPVAILPPPCKAAEVNPTWTCVCRRCSKDRGRSSPCQLMNFVSKSNMPNSTQRGQPQGPGAPAAAPLVARMAVAGVGLLRGAATIALPVVQA